MTDINLDGTENAPLEIGTVDGILAAIDINEKTLPIPAWNCSIRIKSISKGQQAAIRRKAAVGSKNGPDSTKVEMYMFLAGVVEPKFEEHHYHQLLNKNTGVIDHIIEEIAQLSGVGDEAIDAARSDFRG